MSHLTRPNILGYKVVRRLGGGGMGDVYLCEHDTSGSRLAYKVFKEYFRTNPSHAGAVLRELRSMAVMRHPNTVVLISDVVDQEAIGFAMEYCQAGDLASHISASGGALMPERALPIIFDILSGLEFIHSVAVDVRLPNGSDVPASGIVHRDLKPANILLIPGADRLVAKVSDFGLAKSFDLAGFSEQTLTFASGGTRRFMSRSQLLEFKYAKADVDIWAAAAILYFMLSGEYVRRFSSEVDEDLIIETTLPTPIREHGRAANIPSKLAQVIDDALLDDGPLTFGSAASFAEAIRRSVE